MTKKNVLFLLSVLIWTSRLWAQQGSDWFPESSIQEELACVDGACEHSINRNYAFNNRVFAAATTPSTEEFKGVTLLWNYTGYDFINNADDWSYEKYSTYDVFHPETSALKRGYVYMHALITNTNAYPVGVKLSAPAIDVIFDLNQLEWQPAEKGGWHHIDDAHWCNFVRVSKVTKNKILPQSAPQTEIRFFSYSLSGEKIGSEKPSKYGYTGLEPGESVLVKWYAKEQPIPEYVRLLPTGVLPESSSNCIPRDLEPNFYEQCGAGQLDLNFMDVCRNARSQDGRLVFVYFSASQMRVLLNKKLVFGVIKPGSAEDQRTFELSGYRTRSREK